MDQVVQNPPLNIKKQLVERFPTSGSVTFRNVTKDGGGIISVVVEILVEEGVRKQFKGRGRNKKMATLAACKCALRKLDEVE